MCVWGGEAYRIGEVSVQHPQRGPSHHVLGAHILGFLPQIRTPDEEGHGSLTVPHAEGDVSHHFHTHDLAGKVVRWSRGRAAVGGA